MFADLIPELAAGAPHLRGQLSANVAMSELTWLRVGGPAQVLFTPADEEDLGYFLQRCPLSVAVTTVGVGSNLLVRDGGIEGVVIRLGRGFAAAEVRDEASLKVGAALPDVRLAQAAASASIAGFAFYRGIPGTVGGALRMNAGAHGGQTSTGVRQVRAIDRSGALHVLSNTDMGFVYRKCAAPDDFIFTSAILQGEPGNRAAIEKDMQAVAEYREANQPIKSKTGGSTFKNPPGHSAWKLIDAAGCRGLRVGGAHMSEMHCNFLINDGNASASDIETLGEVVRDRVKAESGIELEWEIKRIGIGPGARKDKRDASASKLGAAA